MDARETEVPSTLVELFATGDRDAFLAVYRAYAAPLRRWVARFLRSPFQQEDAVHEVWLAVYRMQSTYDPHQGELRPWLRAATAKRCRELMRAKGRRPDALVPPNDAESALWLDGAGPDDGVLRAKLREGVERFAAGLEDADARVLRHGLIEEQTQEELAAVLGVNVASARHLKLKLLQRAASDPALRALAAELLR